jgi:hypothetical protein
MLGVTPIFVGSDSSFAYSRKEIKKTAFRGLPTFIASKTDEHILDLAECVKLSPSAIYVEKGFSSVLERRDAKDIVGRIPTYIMCQHRYNSLFDRITSTFDVDKVLNIEYHWIIEKDTVSEYLYHIASIDGYLRQRTTQIYRNEFGYFNIDYESNVNIVKGIGRILNIKLETGLYKAEIIISNYNHLTLENKRTEDRHIMSSHGEDTVGKMIGDIVINPHKNKLERL